MRKILPIAMAAAACTLAVPAAATVTIDDTSLENVDGPDTSNGTTTISFDDSNLEEPTFYEWLTLTNDLAGLYSFTVDTSSIDIDFTEVFLSDGSGTITSLSELFDDGTIEAWGLSNFALDAGQYSLNIYGDNRGQGALGGTITITPAVPEPATWMMLLLGFFGVGLALRRNRSTRPAELLRVNMT
ncbi:FxDxF family PEP-CTERM protein [Qipengyuania sphaerica]|uniref:FxDxF family PEP-CTERM protein n=1 Tax=Qipengyuania sphaerica TaxID=2867243 RepID=UPI001C8796BD|nr:FxDxF family PEP-CTERM protein [Qipengyuania sphaerica]MBX7539402.1 FxDxF family PEP-CTERM protein [Qipengyuania sphaerica]